MKRADSPIILPAEAVTDMGPEFGNTPKYGFTWGEYVSWRRAFTPPAELRAPIWLDEMDQAIHEFIGEAAELAKVVLQAGPFVRIDPASRDAVEDEIGDVIFTASWVFDTIDDTFFAQRGRISEGFMPEEMCLEIRSIHTILSELSANQIHGLSKEKPEIQEAVFSWHNEVQATLLTILTNGGMLSNRFKKMRWHRVPQDQDAQAESLFNALVALDALCVLCGLSLAMSVGTNMAKLNKRYPNGWVPGGGIR